MDVIIIGSISYYFPLHQRLHHFADHLAERGHRVLYVEVENARHHFVHPDRGNLEVWDNPRAEASVALAAGLWSSRWASRGGAGRLALRAAERCRLPRILRRAAREILDRDLVPRSLSPVEAYRAKFASFARDDRRVAFFQAPYRVELLPWLRRGGFRVVYDLVDEFTEFKEVPARMARAEARLLGEADLVIATGKRLAERARRHNARVAYIGNGVEYERFAASRRPGPRPEDLPPPGRPVMGYFGAIWDWFAADWLRTAARARPQYDFVLIGTLHPQNARLFAGQENIHFLGEKPYAELPDYLRHFTVALIPFVESRLTEAVNPVKLYEYLCGGKPVVVSPLPEIEGSPGVFTARDADDFVRRLDEAVVWRPDMEAIDRFVRQHTWSARMADFEREIDALWGEGGGSARAQDAAGDVRAVKAPHAG